MTNEGLKFDQRTLFVERELGEVLEAYRLTRGVLPPRVLLAIEHFGFRSSGGTLRGPRASI